MDKSIQIYDDCAKTLFLADSQLEKLTTGATWSEGPVYVHDYESQFLVFWSDIPNNRLVAYTPKKGFFEYQKPSHFANGHTIDLDGYIINCEHGRRCISRSVFGGETTILVDKFEGKRLNSPNDVVVKKDGSIWFSDPRYGILSNDEGYKADSEIGSDNVYRYDPKTDELSCVIDDTIRPNGLAFSPDERLLYVTDTSASHDDDGRHEVRVYTVNDDGKGVSAGKTFAVVEPGLPDGFRLDKQGNLYVSSLDGIQIYHPNGQRIAKILVPEKIANLTFGGDNFDELYIVATTSLYRIRLNTQADIQRKVALNASTS